VKSSFIFLILFIVFFADTHAQQISGTIKDSTTGESLIGATIKVVELNTGTTTNENGQFKLKIADGTYTLTISYLGYLNKQIKVVVVNGKNVNLPLVLSPTVIEKKEALIIGNRNDKNVTSTEMSRVELTAEQVKGLPVIFGEPDVLKAITLLPGIKSGGEGGTGFYVRGGGPDQNLVLMDDAVIYNPSHLLGFLSVFNTDAVKNIEVIKGGMPANYGGRLSSILNVNLKEGNDKKFVTNGGVGLISSRLSVEGPIKKGKSGFMIAGRRTYIDAIARPFLTTEQRANGYYFYDFNAKFHYQFSDKDKIVISAYYGRDIFSFRSPTNNLVRFNVGWGNAAVSAKWFHQYNKKLFSNTVAVYNRYDLNNKFEFGSNGFVLSSGLQDWNLKHDFIYLSGNHNMKFGASYIWHTFTPGIATGQVGTIVINEAINKQYAHEAAIYFLDEFKLGSRLTVNAGLRGVLFTQVGPFTEKIFDDQDLVIGDGKTYKSGEPIVTYPGIEPRLAATYLLNSTTSLKASFNRVYQFLHLATTSGAQFPADLWVPSSQRVKPQLAYQYAVGVYKNFNKNEYETSIEAYYKPMFNQIEFKPGANLFFNQNLENEMVFGEGLSYGIEFFAKKKFGRLTGWIGYTWSRTTRQFDELNNGRPFFFRYDRTHDISIVATYQINNKWTVNGVFVYGTGNATTLPTARYTYQPGFDLITGEPKITFIDLYDRINDYRLPAYHRLDVSFTYVAKQTEKFESSWNFSIYNLYNRANPYFIYFVPDLEAQRVRAYMVYLFPILPSVAWNFKF
jgi:hypothetical protein